WYWQVTPTLVVWHQTSAIKRSRAARKWWRLSL
ncbi:FAD binding domain protein, partial [Vibrio parahaemolyticus V-223/04]